MRRLPFSKFQATTLRVHGSKENQNGGPPSLCVGNPLLHAQEEAAFLCGCYTDDQQDGNVPPPLPLPQKRVESLPSALERLRIASGFVRSFFFCEAGEPASGAFFHSDDFPPNFFLKQFKGYKIPFRSWTIRILEERIYEGS